METTKWLSHQNCEIKNNILANSQRVFLLTFLFFLLYNSNIFAENHVRLDNELTTESTISYTKYDGVGNYSNRYEPLKLISIKKYNPSTNPTNADVLIFKVTFSSRAFNVNTTDFSINGPCTAIVNDVVKSGNKSFDVTVSGGDLPDFNGEVGLDLAIGHDIVDSDGISLQGGEPAVDETYIIDNTAPSIVVDEDITIEINENGEVNITIEDVDNGSTDDNSTITKNIDATDFDCSNLGENIITLTVIDEAGNSSTKEVVVTIRDIIPPTVNTQNIDAYLDENGTTNVSVDEIDNGSTDNCSIENRVLDVSSFDCSNIGENTVILTVTDGSGNSSSASAIVNVRDTISPTVITQDITLELNENGDANISVENINNGSYDNCSITDISLDKTNFDCSNIGENTVTLTVVDANGNSNSSTAIVNVIDNTIPIVIEQNITLELDENGSANIPSLNMSTNCSIEDIKIDKTEFNCSNIGENEVNISITNNNGNTNSSIALVNVVDNIPPTALTKDITLMLDVSGNGTVSPEQIDNGSYDNCAIVSRCLDKNKFDCSDIGQNTIRLSITDASGNRSYETAIVNVVDNTAPIVINQNISAYLTETGKVNISALDVLSNSSSNCDVDKITIDKTSFDCSNVGQNIVTVTIIEENGNTGSNTAIVTVIDTIAPTSIAKNISIKLGENSTASITFEDIDAGSFDNCAIESMSLSKTSFDCSDIGENFIILTATDVNGNIGLDTAIVSVSENIAPVVITKDITVELNSDGIASFTPFDLNNGSYDNCGIDSMALDTDSLFCSNIGANEVVLSAVDFSGNTSSTTAIVTVVDKLAPVVLTKDTTVYLNEDGEAQITPYDINFGSYDNCVIKNLSINKSSFTGADLGYNTITLTVTDINGNISSATALVKVVDFVPYVLDVKDNEGCNDIELSLVSPVGNPKTYRIIFSEEAKDDGFNDTPFKDIPATNILKISIPSFETFGKYDIQIILKNEYGTMSEPIDYEITANPSDYFINSKFNDVVLLDNSHEQFVSYQWYKNGIEIEGATSQFYNESNGLVGSYSAEVETVKGDKLHTCSKYFNTPVKKKASILVYPNPGNISQKVVVKVDNVSNEKLKREGEGLRIVNSKGTVVYSTSQIKCENEIQLSNPGQYFGTMILPEGETYSFMFILK